MMPNVLAITLADAGKSSLWFMIATVAITGVIVLSLSWFLPGKKKPEKGA